MTSEVLIRIGELAAATGVTVSALRHYDEVGVISSTERVGGKRRFTNDTIGRVNFIRRAQRFGFDLGEIRDILDDTSGTARQLASDKIDELRARQVELADMIEMLEEMTACGCRIVAQCPKVHESR